jgi:anaerobic dimethyl sulfoxide reductase subunit C (anchor subunit)
MELMWPLILFTTFIAWSAGLFGAQGLLALTGKAPKAQLPALIASFVLMAVGGIAVFFHLEHWERIFNGFGHLTSGITQELIGIVVMFLVMVVYFALIRRNGADKLPVWSGIVAIVVAIALVVVMGHSYMMPSRPAWDSVLQIISLLGASCVLGPATLALIMESAGDDTKSVGTPVLIGSIINAFATVSYLLVMNASSSAFTSLGYYYDPTQITRGMIDFEAATGVFSGARFGLSIAIIGCVVFAIVLALIGKKYPKGYWKFFGTLIVVAVFAGALILRVLFYELGLSVYMFY